jgi:hypothetical protein
MCFSILRTYEVVVHGLSCADLSLFDHHFMLFPDFLAFFQTKLVIDFCFCPGHWICQYSDADSFQHAIGFQAGKGRGLSSGDVLEHQVFYAFQEIVL